MMEISAPITEEKTYNAQTDTIWAALTTRDQLKQWYFDFSEDFILKLDQVFEWWGGSPDGKQWLHRGVMTEIVEGKKLVHTWEYPGYIGKALVSWELDNLKDEQTHLHFKFEILIPFDPQERNLHRSNFVEGWNYIINTSLKDFVEKE